MDIAMTALDIGTSRLSIVALIANAACAVARGQYWTIGTARVGEHDLEGAVRAGAAW